MMKAFRQFYGLPVPLRLIVAAYGTLCVCIGFAAGWTVWA